MLFSSSSSAPPGSVFIQSLNIVRGVLRLKVNPEQDMSSFLTSASLCLYFLCMMISVVRILPCLSSNLEMLACVNCNKAVQFHSLKGDYLLMFMLATFLHRSQI